MHPTVDPGAREAFYHLIAEVPDSEGGWAERQATLRRWRSEPRFQSYWPTIDHMLNVDFSSFKRRSSLAEAVVPLEGYDFDAWRKQREYDLKHAHDHLL